MKRTLAKTGIYNAIMILFFSMIAPASHAYSNVRPAPFVKKINGSGRITAAIHTSDGNYLTISSKEDSECVVRKTTDSGRRIWERTLSFQVGEGLVFIYGIAETPDGYVLAGEGRFDPNSDNLGMIVKLKTNGIVQWTKTFPPELWSEIGLDGVYSTPDGGYIIEGSTYQEGEGYGTLLVKFASNGNILWSKTYKDDFLVTQPVSDGLILAGAPQQFHGRSPDSLLVLKVDFSGRIVWKETLETVRMDLHEIGSAPGNGVVLVGKSAASNKLILIGLNANGELQWTANYVLEVPDFEVYSMAPTSDGGNVISAAKANPETGGNRGGIVLRIDANHKVLFAKAFDRSGPPENARFVFATAEDVFTVFGSSGSKDMLMLNLNSNGVVPGCRFLHDLNVKKVAARPVTKKALKIVSESVTLPAPGTVEIFSVVSKTPSTSACPNFTDSVYVFPLQMSR